MTKKLSYEEALAEIQEILTDLQNEQTGIDDLAAKSKRASELVAYCREKLRGIEGEIGD